MYPQIHLMSPDEPSGAPAPAAAAPAAAPAASAPAAAPAPAAAAAPAPAADTPGFWNDGWRERMAGDDAKALKQLQRYASPEDVYKKARSLEQRLSSGELRPVLPKDADESVVKEYRAALGIPEAPDKYDLKDVKLDEGDKALAAKVLQAAHGSHQTPDQVKATLTAWTEIKAAAFESQAAADKEAQTKTEDTLRGEWGNEYRRNINLVHGLLDGAGSPNMKQNLLTGRLADGTPIGSSPEALKLLLGLALKDNPAGIVVPAGHADPGKTISDEIAGIVKVMKENRKAYDKDNKMQERYRELIGAQERIKARGG
jgi:hypothetical protein